MEVKVYVKKKSKQAGDTDGLRSCAFGSQFIHYSKVVPGCQGIAINASRTRATTLQSCPNTVCDGGTRMC